MKAIIMAGGRGERLKPITDTIPKPMVEVAGKPILLHIINLFKRYEIKDFIFSLYYLPHIITSYFGDGSKFGIHIDYLIEDPGQPMGTAGGILAAKKYIDDTFIVTSGDILRKINIDEIVKFHKEKNSFATLNTYKRFGPDPKSMIVFDKQGLIKKFIERPNPENIKEDSVWVNGSFYIMEPEIFNFIPKNYESDFGKDVFPKLLATNKKIYAFSTEDYFVDIGNLEKLEMARKTFTP
ncbi:MAG: nucleotidyltransferase family protein [Patescibacteria group bacterium]